MVTLRKMVSGGIGRRKHFGLFSLSVEKKERVRGIESRNKIGHIISPIITFHLVSLVFKLN